MTGSSRCAKNGDANTTRLEKEKHNMDNFEAEIRQRRNARRRRLKSIEDDYQKAQDFEDGKA